MKSGKGPPPQGYGKPPAQLPKAEAKAAARDPEAVRLRAALERLVEAWKITAQREGERALLGDPAATMARTSTLTACAEAVREALAASPEPAEAALLDMQVEPDPVYWNGFRDGKAAAARDPEDVRQAALIEANQRWQNDTRTHAIRRDSFIRGVEWLAALAASPEPDKIGRERGEQG